MRRAPALALLGVAGAIVFLFNPSTASFFPPCLFRALTGIPCPGCGSLRALHALLHGDVAGAWSLNRLFVTGLVLAPAASLLARLKH